MLPLKTGDILLCHAGNEPWPLSWFAGLIRYFTHSPFSHIGMVLYNPTFINPTLTGTFVWESSGADENIDPQDGKHKFGVRITPLADFLSVYEKQGGSIMVRRLQGASDRFTEAILKQVHDTVYAKPYDFRPDDWIKAMFPDVASSITTPTTERFWCSALVGYFYVQAGIIDASTIWSLLSPSNFSSSDVHTLKFLEGAHLDCEQTIL